MDRQPWLWRARVVRVTEDGCHIQTIAKLRLLPLEVRTWLRLDCPMDNRGLHPVIPPEFIWKVEKKAGDCSPA